MEDGRGKMEATTLGLNALAPRALRLTPYEGKMEDRSKRKKSKDGSPQRRRGRREFFFIKSGDTDFMKPSACGA
jgi:hypothetical protein